MEKKIVVIGGGPTGLGACTRLQQLGHKNWLLIEKNDYTGGLATSFPDPKGFWWDIGVHVTFSHYQYFTDLIDQGVLAYAKKHLEALEEDDKDLKIEKLWCTHKRECWARFDPDSFLPYPFQNNFFYSKNTQVIKDCFDGLLEIYANRTNPEFNQIKNFEDLIYKKFGKGLAEHFMIPYNLQVWGYPAKDMNHTWIGERVAMVDVQKILGEYIQKNEPKDSKSMNWGPNNTFRYPKYGGIGAIWKGVGYLLDENNLMLKTEVTEIDIDKKEVKLSNGKSISYDYLINTLPIDLFLTKMIKKTQNLNVEDIFERHQKPKHSKVNVIGLGFECDMPEELKNKSWMYFPNLERSIFYRLTVLSNYSPYMVAKPGKQWSLMAEICETDYLPERKNLIDETIKGLLNENIIESKHLDHLISKHEFSSEYGYPTPYLHRDDFLNEIEPILRRKFSIYSRGRFGGWKYEVSNQDHSLMQGVEAADNILFGCEEQTFFYPDHVNGRKEQTRRFVLN
ncbi:amine oxidase [Brachionus plicatilis]|uniref:Amine oxidase n=1 Tax=Brachionus plicatilis TaxID=10195 RepID=A0A3M7PPR3_BRAPC|nr:amine oxidase [Brachionus plicatilis]